MLESRVVPTLPISLADPLADVGELRFGLTHEEIMRRLAGVASFDPHGMLEGQLIDPVLNEINWGQLIFQAICLQSLLHCCLQMAPASQCYIRNTQYDMLLINQQTRYFVLFLRH